MLLLSSKNGKISSRLSRNANISGVVTLPSKRELVPLITFASLLSPLRTAALVFLPRINLSATLVLLATSSI